MSKTKAKKPLTKGKKALLYCSPILLLLCMVLLFFLVAGIKTAVLHEKYSFSAHVEQSGGYKIHFLNVSNSDAILIESNGKFGMIDCAEDSDNPRNFENLNLEGHEEEVINYVKKVAGDKDGKVTLDFVLGTHAHSDHIGGFDTLISDPDITVKRAYLKRYFSGNINEEERTQWDNQEVYDQMVAAIQQEDGCVLVQDDLEHRNISQDIGWDETDFQLTIFNGLEDKDLSKSLGENENSMTVLVEKYGKTVLLTGDMNDIGEDSDEDRVAKELKEDFSIDHIDVLKAGHHGYKESTSKDWVNALQPNICIIPNYAICLNPTSWLALVNNDASIYGVLDHKGIVVELKEDGIALYDKI